MMSIRPLVLLAALTLLLASGCRRPVTQQVYVAPGIPFRLCRPEEGPDLFVNQEVVFQFPGGRRETALAVIENHAGTLSLVAATPVGQTLFTVQVREGVAKVDARIAIPGALDPRIFPALVQFALWPADDLRRNLGPGVQFQEEGPRRTLLRKGKVAWTVTREGEAPPYRTLELENPALGLKVHIRTVEE